MSDFWPFPQPVRPISELTVDDILALKDVQEGWFVDYKETSIGPEKFGKHLSAFANQHGGWLLVGVKDGKNNEGFPAGFPGIPSEDVSKVLEQIRVGVTTNVSTQFYFETFPICGTEGSAELPMGRSVIVVRVPSGPNPPYVHSGGRIYRRIGDSSEPKPETDRAVLDQLWDRSRRSEDRLHRFLLKPIEGTAEHLRRAPVAQIYLIAEPLFGASSYQLSFLEFVDILKRTETPYGSEALWSFGTTNDGLVARIRFTGGAEPKEIQAIRWWRDGTIRMTVPFQTLRSSVFWADSDSLQFLEFRSLANQSKFHVAMDHGYTGPPIVDVGSWLLELVTMCQYATALRHAVGLDDEYVCKAVIKGVRSVVPFIPTESYIRQCTSAGLPVVEDDLFLTPDGLGPESFLRIAGQPAEQSIELAQCVAWPIAEAVLNGIGVLTTWTIDDPESLYVPDEFVYAVNATQTAKHRSKIKQERKSRQE